jgi:protease YdgD
VRRRLALAALLGALAAGPAHGGGAVRHDPSLGETLETVDAAAPPWSAIGRVNNSVGGSCTGVLVARDRVLTAGHCVYYVRTRRFLRAESIHVLLGFARGDYLFHARAASYTLGPGYDPSRGASSLAQDYAILTLDRPAPDAIVPIRLADALPPAGTPLVAVGYARQRAFVPTVIRGCASAGPADAAASLLAADCAAPAGYSGGPLLTAGDDPEVVGMDVAVARRPGVRRTLAIPAGRIAARLAAGR